MIKNINLLQNPKDIEFDNYSEEYVIQALANLGQRIGIKGDGISYKHFTFSEICDETVSYSLNDHIGYIRYIKGENDAEQYKGIFGIVDKKTLNNYKPISESISINNCLYFPTSLSFDIPINNIDSYAKNSICINNNGELTYMLAGKYMGSDDDDEFNTALYYYKYDTNLNKLKYGAKLFHIDSTNNENLVCLLNIINKTYKENGYTGSPTGNEYIMNIYIYNPNYLSNIYKTSFNNIFKYSTYNSNSVPFSIINYEYEDISKLINYSNDESLNYDSNSAISLILNSSQESLYSSYSLSLLYNSNNFVFDEDENLAIINLYKNEYDVNITQELFELNEDNINLYYNIFNYYNNKFYLNSRTEFIKRILLKLYETISEDVESKENILYIPLDYQFHYICNSNNELNIYYSNNLYVTFTQINKLNLEYFFENNKNLIYDYDSIDKVKCFNFELNYNSHDETLINDLSIKTIYTMPYINAANNWSINDNDSKIYAIGKDAGNPNILIMNSIDDNNTDNSYKMMNAIYNKSQKIDNTQYKQKWFYVDPALFNNSNNISTDIECCTYMPILDDSNIDYLKNSIILSLSNKECIHKDYRDDYMSSYVLSIWHIVENNNKYEFNYLKQESNNKEYAICLGTTMNLLNSFNNNNAQNILVLKAVVSKLAQEMLSESSNNYLIIKNKLSEEYQTTTNNLNAYLNDLNGIIQYYDTAEKNDNNYVYTQSTKYITDISDIQNVKTTNSLYPKYNIVINTAENVEEFIQVISTINMNTSEFIRYSKIYVDNKYITNSESLQELLTNTTVFQVNERTIEYKYENAEETNENYSEYIFNTNVPTLDFAEIFNRNFNVLNRINVISLTNDGKLYNAYIGTSYDNEDKTILHIGSTSTNINIGSETLMSEVDKHNFNVHDTLSLDFNKIILNSSELCSNTFPYIKRSINNITYYIANNIPLIGLYRNKVHELNKDEIFINKDYIVNIYNSSNDNVTLPQWIDDIGIEYYNNKCLIDINSIMLSVFNKDLIKVYIENTINVYVNNELYNDNILKLNDEYIIEINNSLEDLIDIGNDVYYHKSTIDIMYYETENTLNIYIKFNN